MEYVTVIFKMYFVYLNGVGMKFHHPGKGEGEPGTADVIWELTSNSQSRFQPWIFFFFLFWSLTGFQILFSLQLVESTSPEL